MTAALQHIDRAVILADNNHLASAMTPGRMSRRMAAAGSGSPMRRRYSSSMTASVQRVIMMYKLERMKGTYTYHLTCRCVPGRATQPGPPAAAPASPRPPHPPPPEPAQPLRRLRPPKPRLLRLVERLASTATTAQSPLPGRQAPALAVPPKCAARRPGRGAGAAATWRLARTSPRDAAAPAQAKPSPNQ